jgi:hypothetical protein
MNAWGHYWYRHTAEEPYPTVTCDVQGPPPKEVVDEPNCPACNQPLLYSFSMVQPSPTTPVMLAMLWCVRCKHLITSQFLPLLPIAPGTEGKGPLNI